MNETWQLDRTLTSPRIGGEPPRLRLVPLTLEHAEAFLAATSDRPDEVFAHLSYDPPRDLEQARAVIERLNAPATQQPYAQIVAETGEFAGTTSFYDIDPKLRALAIGHTWISRPWWRSWLNTSSKLTLLTHAFEQLGAERMVWHTDIRNLRSRQAILRLGAQQEGVLRHHRIRRDGSWRDTVQFSMLADEWPAARDRLYERLALGSAEAGTSDSGREGRS